MTINPEIFKAYDIRGTFPDQVNTEVFYLIGRALVKQTKAKKVVVGHDMRNSSKELEGALIKGITEQEAEAIKIGLSSTPMLYYAAWKLKSDAAAIITASHNPAEYNGLKMCFQGTEPIGEGSGMEEIKQLVLENNFLETEKKGKIKEKNIRQDYSDYVFQFIDLSVNNKKKVVFDFGNGMGIAEKLILEKMKKVGLIEPIYLYDEYDGNFPHHEANPLKTETLADLQEKVLATGADLGVAFDGDADRVGFVDEKGQIIPMDYPIAFLAEEVLEKNPGSLILIDLRSSNAVSEYIQNLGGKTHNCRVGHSLIKKQMREEGAIFAGELSGHYFFSENHKAEMAMLAVIKIINLLNQKKKTLSELTTVLKKYFHSGEINSEVKDKQAVFSLLKEKYKTGKLNELDGVRIDFEDWWFNVRASNTEPKIRLNLEAKTKELMEEKTVEILKIIRG